LVSHPWSSSLVSWTSRLQDLPILTWRPYHEVTR
jgi:hypothetical protein